VHAGNPLLIRRKERESRGKVIADKFIGLLERIYPDAALHQSDCDDFRIGKSRRSIRRVSPLSQALIGFEELITEDVSFSHLIYNGSEAGRPPGVKMSLVTSFCTPSGL
jgi:hypothetical protein